MPSSNAQNIIYSIQGEISKIDKYGKDQSGVEVPRSITKTTIAQNSSGLWSQTDTNVENPYKSSDTIRSEISSERETTINNYTAIGIPFDDEIAELTKQINDKKAQIVTKVTQAVGAGCSVTFYDDLEKVGNFFRMRKEPPPPIVVNGVTIGYGKTVTKDTATVEFYDYQSNVLSDSPYSSSSADISVPGSETIVYINSATSVGNVSAGSTEVTGINTGGLSVGLFIEPVEAVISSGSSIASIGINTVFMSQSGLSTVTAQTLKFGYFTTSLTPYSGKGYSTVLRENSGSSLGNYGVVDGNALQITTVPGGQGQPSTTVTTTVPSALCAGIRDEILSIAAEIIPLREKRNTLSSPVNEVKTLKSGRELQKWSEQRSAKIIAETPAELNNVINTLQNY